MLICTFKNEEGNTEEIHWNGIQLVTKNNEIVNEGERIFTLKKAIEAAYDYWQAWEDFDCLAEFEDEDELIAIDEITLADIEQVAMGGESTLNSGKAAIYVKIGDYHKEYLIGFDVEDAWEDEGLMEFYQEIIDDLQRFYPNGCIEKFDGEWRISDYWFSGEKGLMTWDDVCGMMEDDWILKIHEQIKPFSNTEFLKEYRLIDEEFSI
jgi:hypothetical protein